MTNPKEQTWESHAWALEQLSESKFWASWKLGLIPIQLREIATALRQVPALQQRAERAEAERDEARAVSRVAYGLAQHHQAENQRLREAIKRAPCRSNSIPHTWPCPDRDEEAEYGPCWKVAALTQQQGGGE